MMAPYVCPRCKQTGNTSDVQCPVCAYPDPPMEPDEYLAVWSDSPAHAAAFFGYRLGVTARVEVQDRSDGVGRVLYHVFPF